MEKIKPKIEYFKGLIMHFWLIILIASVIGCFLGGIISRINYQPEYQMTQAFTIEIKSHPNANKATIGEAQLSKTVPALLSSETFMEHMAPIIKEAGAKGKFKVTSLETSNIFYITCIARNNNDAQIIINEIREHYTDLADYVIGQSEMKFLAPPSYNRLPINAPHYTISAVAGLVAGGLIVCIIFLLLSLLSNTVTSAENMEDTINTKCLATIKRVYHKKRSDQKEESKSRLFVTDEKTDFYYKKSISTLSANVHQACQKNSFKSILVTSTVSGEGKSTIALNLALDLADKGQRVVLVDCDLRSPSIAKYLGITDSTPSLSNAIEKYDFNQSIAKTNNPNLYFCGNTKNDNQNFNEINDKNIKGLINYLKSSFDYIIIDTAPVGFLGDAISISNAVDCFLYVISYNGVNKYNILRCISTLNETNSNMLGFVLNNK